MISEIVGALKRQICKFVGGWLGGCIDKYIIFEFPSSKLRNLIQSKSVQNLPKITHFFEMKNNEIFED